MVKSRPLLGVAGRVRMGCECLDAQTSNSLCLDQPCASCRVDQALVLATRREFAPAFDEFV